MKFEIGQEVRHKMSKKRYIIIRYLPCGFFRKTPRYLVEGSEENEESIFECVLEEVKK